MTENMKVAMTAINKWIYYALNYNVVEVEVQDFDGTHTENLPDCFNAFPMNIRKHFAGKFRAYYEDVGSDGVMTKFYAEIGKSYQKMLMEWVLNNFNGEQKLYFKEEE